MHTNQTKGTKEIHKNIKYSFGSTTFDLSFKIKAKSMTSIIGSTGSGKTTLIDILLGFYQPNSGNLKVDGIELTNDNRRIFNKDIGYVPQTVNLQENSLSMNIALGIEKKYINIERLNKIIQIRLNFKDCIQGSSTI